MHIRELQKGTQYQLLKDIVDFHDQSFSEGQRLIFQERHFLPHDDGHTLVFSQERQLVPGSFREISIYLQGADHRDICENAEQFFKPV